MPDKREEKHSFITLEMNGYHFSPNFSPIDSETHGHHQSITQMCTVVEGGGETWGENKGEVVIDTIFRYTQDKLSGNSSPLKGKKTRQEME